MVITRSGKNTNKNDNWMHEDDKMHEYKMEYIYNLNHLYKKMAGLDTVNHDDAFWRLYDKIDTGYFNIMFSRKCYYAQLKENGGVWWDCSLTRALTKDNDLLNNKQCAIWHKLKECRAILARNIAE